MPLDDQCVNLLVGIRLRNNFVVVPSDDHGLDVTRHFDPIVVSVHRKVLNVISDPLGAVVLVDRVRVLLRGLRALARGIVVPRGMLLIRS